MPVYQITEHHGRRITERWIMGMPDAETALRLSARPPFKRPVGMDKWRFIDDGLGGGALIDPNDEDHCFRADPRPEIDGDVPEEIS
jgi:hypothetical protein